MARYLTRGRVHTPSLVITPTEGKIIIKKFLILSLSDTKRSPDDGLLAAAQSGNIESANRYLMRNADIEWRADDQSTPLYLAVRNGQLKMVKFLVGKHANVNAKDLPNSMTILMEAVRVNKPDILQFLLNSDANIDARGYSNRTCLHQCCVANYMEMIKMVVEKNPDMNAKDDEGMTPVHLAVQTDPFISKTLKAQ